MMEFTTWSMPNPPPASAAAATAAANSVYAVVTPTGDEFELLHTHHHNDNSVFLESAVGAVSAARPAAAGGGNNTTFPCCEYYPSSFPSSTKFTSPYYGASYDHPFSSLVPGYHHTTADHHDYDGSEKMEAAQALCFMKNLDTGCPPQQRGTVVDVAMKMMSSEKNEQFHNEQEGALLRSLDVTEESPTSDNLIISNSLVHPDRLAIDDDVDEVNKLHQYVRKELLEIFVVPQTSGSDTEEEEEEEEEDDEDFRVTKKSRRNNQPPSRLPTTRAAAARRESFASATASMSESAIAAASSTQRHYPGRVGFRCVHCADCRRKSASKAAFFPLRLTNIYREVCAWQRIHFKTCPMVPESVREKYDHYKMIDTSRGKVRYWESSAKKIGLQNNPDRYVK
jgi:hypothetical protein